LHHYQIWINALKAKFHYTSWFEAGRRQIRSQLADCHLADWTSRGLDNSRTSQLVDWTSRGLTDAAKKEN